MLNDLSEAVESCSVSVEVTRWLASPVVRGRKQGKTASEVFPMMASVQPMGPKQLQRLPEGSRTEGAITLHSSKRLLTLQTEIGQQADNVLYNGENYQVQSVEDWFDLGGYYLASATRVAR